MLGVSTGGRISELLSLRIGDVYQNDKPVSDLLFDRSIVKGGEVSRAVPVNKDGRLAIDDLVNWYRGQYAKHRSQPSALSVSQRSRHAADVATHSTQRTENCFYGCRFERSPRDPLTAEKALRSGCTIVPVIFSLSKRCWGIRASRRRKSIWA